VPTAFRDRYPHPAGPRRRPVPVGPRPAEYENDGDFRALVGIARDEIARRAAADAEADRRRAAGLPPEWSLWEAPAAPGGRPARVATGTPAEVLAARRDLGRRYPGVGFVAARGSDPPADDDFILAAGLAAPPPAAEAPVPSAEGHTPPAGPKPGGPFPAAAAYHEAGHAVVAHLLGVPVADAEVEATGDGLTRFVTPRRVSPRREAVVFAAGAVAEARACGRGNPSTIDRAEVAAMQARLGPHPFDAPAVAGGILARPPVWAAVRDVADRLSSRGRVSGELVAALAVYHLGPTDPAAFGNL
jgi:hypothetical protein